jgi:hypothetical protein
VLPRALARFSSAVCTLSEEGFFAVTKLHAQHTCVGAARVARSVENTQRWLLLKIPEVIAIDGKMTPKQIVDNLRLKFGVDVNEKAARRTAHHNERSLPTSRDAHLKLNLDPDTGAIRSLFICPQTSREAFRHCRKIVAMDGTLTKNAVHRQGSRKLDLEGLRRMKHAPEVPTTVATAGKPVTPLLTALPGCQWPRNSGSTNSARGLEVGGLQWG